MLQSLLSSCHVGTVYSSGNTTANQLIEAASHFCHIHFFCPENPAVLCGKYVRVAVCHVVELSMTMTCGNSQVTIVKCGKEKSSYRDYSRSQHCPLFQPVRTEGQTHRVGPLFPVQWLTEIYKSVGKSSNVFQCVENMRHLYLVLIQSLVMSVLADCSHSDGDSCNGDTPCCTDSKTIAECHDGKWSVFQCSAVGLCPCVVNGDGTGECAC